MAKMVLSMFKRCKVKVLFSLLLFTSVFCNCNIHDKQNGFRLNEFVIDDVRLKCIVDSMVEMHLSALKSNEEKKIISLNFSQKDSVKLFAFSLREENELIERYIYRENKRIVGFTYSGKVEVILLSDIDDLSELGREFGKFIHPTGDSRACKYMRFPENLYVGDRQCKWPDFELVYDPTYIVYPYLNNTFLRPVMTNDPSLYSGQKES